MGALSSSDQECAAKPLVEDSQAGWEWLGGQLRSSGTRPQPQAATYLLAAFGAAEVEEGQGNWKGLNAQGGKNLDLLGDK